MKGESNYIIYTAADIHNYIAGKLTTAEMHAMERAALTDPFLAEAIEGFSASPAMKDEQAFEQLQQELDGLKDKLGDKKVVSGNWWKIAAAVLLLLGAAAAIHTITTKPAQAPVAKSTPAIKPVAIDTTIQLASVNAITKNPGQTLRMPYTAPVIKHMKLIIADSQMLYANTTPTKQIDTVQPIDNDGQLDAYQSTMVQNEFDKKLYDSVGSPANRTVMMKTRRKVHVEGSFAGNITDSNNNAIPYANIFIQQHTTQTDAGGSFTIPATDTAADIEISANGFYTKLVTLHIGSATTITLAKSLLRKDTSVDGRMRSKIELLHVLATEPKIGWSAYLDYMTTQLSYSEYDDGKPVTGQMILNFKIDLNSMPTDFHFEESIDDDVDTAVMQLIKNGPSWLNTKGLATPGYVRLRIIFN